MANLFLITGPAGVGKSTISYNLATKLNKSAVIEGDTIYNQVVGSYQAAWKKGNHLKLFWEICVENIKLYLKNGYDVVFNYIIKPEDINLFKGLSENTKLAVLLADADVLLSRDSKRPEDCQMKERCLVLLNNFKNRNYNKSNIINTSALSKDEVVNLILVNDDFRI